jgi:hypothetical protein
MVNYKLSPKWESNKNFKDPFHYIVGKGQVTDEQAEAYDGDDQLVQIIRLDMADILKLGMAEELDFMSKALISSDKKAEDNDASKALENAIKSASNFSKMEIMINKIVQRGIVNPKFYMPPEHENARQKGLNYIDTAVPFEDRMELFSVIFETEGLSDFRAEQETGVGNVEHESVVQLPADGPVAELRSNDT